MAAPAHANPKYAAIVIDATTNQVLHQANPDAIRHPASLTKMMTLYLAFDALKRGRLTLSQQLNVSERAASMPATNLSLKAGDRITVELAIKALIVRSANDVAVVMGEALGQTEWQFAVTMTNKARQLGMSNTVYKNASGLPDVRQVTTARDQAKLSLALRRDFPQYYHYFKVEDFTHNGRTYQTHNRVMRDYPGADGLKTGYVNMSGFNLATSVRRDGYSLVAVVLGGRTSRSRDDHMKDLLNRTLRQLADGKKPGSAAVVHYAAETPAGGKRSPLKSSPVPVFKPGTEPAGVVTPIAEGGNMGATLNANELARPAATYAPAPAAPQGLTIQGVPAQPQPQSATDRGVWGIQVGAFSESRDAFAAASKAMNMANRELEGAQINVVAPQSGEKVFRARIANMDEAQARRACKVLVARKEACFVYQGG